MTSLETYQTRFDEDAWQVFLRVLQTARRVGHSEITESHLLQELLSTEGAIFGELFQQLAIDPVAFRAQLEQQLNAKIVRKRLPLRLDSNLIELLKFAWNRTLANGRDRISITNLVAAFAQTSESSLVSLLKSFGPDEIQIATAMLGYLQSRQNEGSVALSETELSESAFREGDVVRIKSGPFSAFSGRVRQINPSQSTVTVRLLNAPGKLQTLELLFSQVQKQQFS
jgi:ATP-dependent Clp protease ATP-binding subunit ClpA